jgi:hypothetical protein
MIEVTHDVVAPGYATSGGQHVPAKPYTATAQQGGEYVELAWASEAELAAWAACWGPVAVTPLEHSGHRWYYGPGESRYRHDRRRVLGGAPARRGT